MIRALIVDDERLARVELRRLLEAHPEVEIVGEASDVAEAREAVEKLVPDLVFLDVQMPGGTGFDLLETLEDALPEIIFVTAFDEHALKAFEFNALDYLLKPVDPARLTEAVQRARGRISKRFDESEPHPQPTSRLSAEDRVFLRDGDRCWLLPLRDIVLFESDGNYTNVRFGGNCAMLPRSLSSMEERLDPSLFFRANRSQIINIHKVKGVDLWFSGSLKATMEGALTVELSRRQAAAFREKLSL
ncbi:MAG TPA: LytTR family DNA-binding domain-containing protein [Opitutales bacterium]|nr:LytTR family DNA-binding domain-containing protein [Opitutales bacterium]